MQQSNAHSSSPTQNTTFDGDFFLNPAQPLAKNVLQKEEEEEEKKKKLHTPH